MRSFAPLLCTLFFVIGAGGVLPQLALSQPSDLSMTPLKTLSRWRHAQELLGKQYWKSVVRSGERISNIDHFLFKWIQKALLNLKISQKVIPGMTRQMGETIILESEKYGFDPVLLMALIQSESSFNPKAMGKAGEIGLMQLKFSTAEWIARKFSISYNGPHSLENPTTNIQIGSAYLAYLRKEFAFQSLHYLEAYNKGSGNVKKEIAKKAITRKYSTRVLNAYVQFYTRLLA